MSNLPTHTTKKHLLNDEVVFDNPTEDEKEDAWIYKMTRKSAMLTVVIALFFVADELLPTTTIDEPCQEFIFEGNTLRWGRTESITFPVAQEHFATRFLSTGNIRINVSPLTKQVSSYSVEQEDYRILHYPIVGVHAYAYLMELLLVLSLAQLTAPLGSYPRLGIWVFGMGCLLGFLLVLVSSTP